MREMVDRNIQAQKSNDCYFYYYSFCAKGDKCPFRHESSALGNETVCCFWKSGGCNRDKCSFRHMNITVERKSVPCYWESQPSGCLKIHCPFLHKESNLKLSKSAEKPEKANVRLTAGDPDKLIITNSSKNVTKNLPSPTSSNNTSVKSENYSSNGNNSVEDQEVPVTKSRRWRKKRVKAVNDTPAVKKIKLCRKALNAKTCDKNPAKYNNYESLTDYKNSNDEVTSSDTSDGSPIHLSCDNIHVQAATTNVNLRRTYSFCDESTTNIDDSEKNSPCALTTPLDVSQPTYAPFNELITNVDATRKTFSPCDKSMDWSDDVVDSHDILREIDSILGESS